ncbi:MAG: M15 family metallopeptidase [Clostridia bacterium]|nr:M15 family metallopeptidase [Clostridia bacterium]
MRRLMIICLALLCGFVFSATAENMPEWEYPLKPEIIYDFDQYIALVNRTHLLDSGYEPSDLVATTVKRSSDAGATKLRKAASDALTEMFDAASEAGYTLYLKSAYRTYQTQKTMYNNRLQKMGRDDGLVAYPGSSDHQTGLGADILNYAWTKKDGMNKEFAKTAEAQWMEAHCHEFGFVLRYMEDKEDITAIKFEPWHFRYVGREAAAYIMENHLSLEEFTEEWENYVAEYEANGGNFHELILWRARVRDAVVVRVDENGEEEYSIFY